MGCAETPPTQTAIVEGQGAKQITVSMGGCDEPIQSDDQSLTSRAPASVCEETGPIHTSWGVAVARTGRIIPLGVGTGSCRPAQPGELIPTPRPTPAPAEPCTALPGWTRQGEQLRAGKKAAYQDHPGYAERPGSNAGDYAYPSQPIDIHGPGTYTVDFGPLDQAEPSAPGIVLFSPPDYGGQFTPTTEPSIITRDGARYLRQPIELTGPARPCTQLVIWLV